MEFDNTFSNYGRWQIGYSPYRVTLTQPVRVWNEKMTVETNRVVSVYRNFWRSKVVKEKRYAANTVISYLLALVKGLIPVCLICVSACIEYYIIPFI